jgi:hypothetical protein
MATTQPETYSTLAELETVGFAIAKQQLDELVRDGKVRVVLYNGKTLYSETDVSKLLANRPLKGLYYTTGGVGNRLIAKYDAVYGEIREGKLFNRV